MFFLSVWNVCFTQYYSEQDIIYNLGYEFSKSQRKKLNDKLDDYASDLWKNKKKANMYDVENIVNGIAIR